MRYTISIFPETAFATNAAAGRPHLYYITEGHTVFVTPSGNQEVSSGELLYIPRRQRYTATWTGEPDIDFYGIDFGFELKSEFGAIPGNTGLYDSFVLQKPQVQRISTWPKPSSGSIPCTTTRKTQDLPPSWHFMLFLKNCCRCS